MEPAAKAQKSAAKNNNNNNNNNATKTNHHTAQNHQKKSEFLIGHVALTGHAYRNRLPPVPFDPKLLQIDEVSDMKRKSADPGSTNLEKRYKYEVQINSDLGVKLDLINPKVYTSCPEAPIHPDDQILIEGKLPEEIRAKMYPTTVMPSTSAPKVAKPATQRANIKRPDPKEVHFLRKFDLLTSINNDETLKSQQTTQKLRRARLLEGEEEMETVTRISKTFDHAQNLPRHPTNPSLVPDQIFEILPNFALWPRSYHSVIFDRNPDLHGPPAVQKELKEKAILRNYPKSVTQLNRDVLVYLTPKMAAAQQPSSPIPDSKKEMMDLFGEDDDDDQDNLFAPQMTHTDSTQKPTEQGGGDTSESKENAKQPKESAEEPSSELVSNFTQNDTFVDSQNIDTTNLKTTQDYDWIHMYNVDLKNRDTPECQDLFVLSFHGEKALFNPVASRFTLHRTPVPTIEKFFKTIVQPSNITVQTFEPSPEKLEKEESQKLQQIFPPNI